MRGVAALFLMTMMFVSAARADEYRISSGDVLDFAVAGVPDLQRRASVGMDGSVVLPVIGRLDASGLTLDELHASVAAGLAHKSIPLRKADGTEDWVIFNPDQIIVGIAEYRPVYIDGDIAKPGEQVYRANMTVRQAVAMAGGYAFMRLKMDNPIIEVTELQSQYDILKMKYESTRARMIRINDQLADKAAFEAPDSSSDPLRQQMEQMEAKQMLAMNVDYAKERAGLELDISKAAKRMSYLVAQQQTDEEGSKEDSTEFERVKGLFSRGLVQIGLLNDARRAVLLSATRSLQTNAEVTQLEREQGALERALVKLDNQRRLDLLTDLQLQTTTLADANTQMQATSEKLLYMGGLRSQLSQSGGRHAEISITRVADGTSRSIAAGEDAALMPGDVIQVSLNPGFQTQASQSSSTLTK